MTTTAGRKSLKLGSRSFNCLRKMRVVSGLFRQRLMIIARHLIVELAQLMSLKACRKSVLGMAADVECNG